MNTNLYLVEKLDHQHRQDLVDQAVRDRTVAQVTPSSLTRNQSKRRLILIAVVLIAATLLIAGPRAFTAFHTVALAVVSLCC